MAFRYSNHITMRLAFLRKLNKENFFQLSDYFGGFFYIPCGFQTAFSKYGYEKCSQYCNTANIVRREKTASHMWLLLFCIIFIEKEAYNIVMIYLVLKLFQGYKSSKRCKVFSLMWLVSLMNPYVWYILTVDLFPQIPKTSSISVEARNLYYLLP